MDELAFSGNETLDLDCSIVSRLAKEGIWLKGMVNNVAVDTFVDWGSKYSLIDFDVWKRICMGTEPEETFVQLVGDGGENYQL